MVKDNLKMCQQVDTMESNSFQFPKPKYKFSRIIYSILNTQKSKLKKLIIELRVHNTCNAHKEIISLPFGRSGMCK